jgi:F-type H+-transporting ATPase subunit gamma
MPSVRDLRDRIRSLKNTQQITKAMKQVAAARIRRAEALQKQSRPYADAMCAMLRDLIANVSSVDHPFMKPGKQGAPIGVILVTADKGLAGAFNANVIRASEQYRRENANVRMYAVGIKSRNAVRRGTGAEPTKFWALNAQAKIDTARELAQQVSDDFVNGEIGEIVLISSKLVSMMSQKPEVRPIIPLTRENAGVAQTANAEGPKGAVEFEPSPEAVLSRLLPKYLEFTLYSALLETDASFFAAQLIAMNNATDNAKKIMDLLTIQMNNARQASITKEILEIVGGAEALAG